MKVRQIMTTNVECIAPDAGVAELARKMKTLDVGFIPICENDRLAGTVTDRDIVIRGIAGGRDLNTCKARDINCGLERWSVVRDPVTPCAVAAHVSGRIAGVRRHHTGIDLGGCTRIGR